jgi:hypothetical protein
MKKKLSTQDSTTYVCKELLKTIAKKLSSLLFANMSPFSIIRRTRNFSQPLATLARAYQSVPFFH